MRLLKLCSSTTLRDYRLYIEQKHGADPSNWPAVWNFARAVRNTVAHGGCVHFHSASASAASW